MNRNGLRTAFTWITAFGGAFAVMWIGFNWAFEVRADTDSNAEASKANADTNKEIVKIVDKLADLHTTESAVNAKQREQCMIGLLPKDICYANAMEWHPRQ